jgi:hypothetical protein
MRDIVTLLRVPEPERDTYWLQEMLGNAVKLELATLPPYLSALWSIKNPGDPRSQTAYNTILGVIFQEMLHMGLACNMLTTIEGTPEINANIPIYPGHLPGGVRPELTVYLAGLTKPVVSDVFMEIELPEWMAQAKAAAWLARANAAAGSADQTYTTIGAFYSAILKAFPDSASSITGKRQLQMPIGEDTVFPIVKLEDAEQAITTIMEQGEGTQQSPLDQDPGGELAHYYRFGEIFNGHVYQQTDGKWAYDGPVVPFPDAYPMKQVPRGGYPELLQEVHFRQLFSTVLDYLQSAWEQGSETLLDNAISFMFTLGPLAQQLMQIPLPDGSGNYGPDFRLYAAVPVLA